MAVPARAYLSIGEVLAKLRNDYPEVTISKIRFLESEGLIEPQRTPSGYRKFTNHDLERLRYVLGVQRDHYLPLRVIKDHLEAIDRGLEPPVIPGGTPMVPKISSINGERVFAESSDLKLSRNEILSASGLSDEQLAELESYGLIISRARHFDGDALAIARSVAAMSAFGIEARHLRSFKSSADREIGLVEQVITPLLRQKSAEAKARAQEVERELAGLTLSLHGALVRAGLNRGR